jgi:hypothetical protein
MHLSLQGTGKSHTGLNPVDVGRRGSSTGMHLLAKNRFMERAF